jgi:hypothetical protein
VERRRPDATSSDAAFFQQLVIKIRLRFVLSWRLLPVMGILPLHEPICSQPAALSLMPDLGRRTLDRLLDHGVLAQPAKTSRKRKGGRRLYTPAECFRIDRINAMHGCGVEMRMANKLLDTVLPGFFTLWQRDSTTGMPAPALHLAAVNIRRDLANCRLVRRGDGGQLHDIYPGNDEPWAPAGGQVLLLVPMTAPWEFLLERLWQLYYAPEAQAR